MTTENSETTYGVLNAKSGKRQPLAMQELHLGGKVLPVGAVLDVRHTFRIESKRKTELIYSFGLPRDAALRRFKILGDGFTVDSELRPTDEAARIYEEGIENGHLSSLARAYRDGIVNLSVGNVRPGETVTVLLDIVAGVEIRDDGFRFRFPFTLAPGYHPKSTSSTADDGSGEIELPEDTFGDVILPRWQAKPDGLHAVSFNLEVHAASEMKGIGSPSHPIRIEQGAALTSSVTLAINEDVPNRDLVLGVKVKEDETGLYAAASPDGDSRFVAVLPSKAFGEAAEQPRRLVLTLDRSSSMVGAPVDQARKAVEAVLGALSEEDLFTIVAFDSVTEVFSDELVPGSSESRDRASDYLGTIDARGGTEMAAALKKAAEVLGDDGGDVFLLTDGQVFGSEDITSGMGRSGVRVHTLGIGSAGEDRFLAQLARSTNGVSRSVTPRERIDLAVLDLFSAVKAPLATDVTAALTGAGDSEAIEPAPASTVFKGFPLVVYGNVNGSGEATLRLTWQAESGEGLLDLPIVLDGKVSHGTLKLIQGARLIADLESTLGAPGRGAAARKEFKRRENRLCRLSEAYGLASRVMALVAVVKRTGDKSGEAPETTVVPVGMPEGVEMGAYFQRDVASAAPMMCAEMRQGSFYKRRYASPAYDEEIFHAVYQKTDEEDVPPPPCSAEETAATDFLMDLARQIEPDGGMPGQTDGERAFFSAVALMAFSHAHAEWGTERFGPHVHRLIAFLESGRRVATSDLHRSFVQEVVNGASESRKFFRSWEEMTERCNRLLERPMEDSAWEVLHQLV